MGKELSYDPTLGMLNRRSLRRKAVAAIGVFATTVTGALQLFQINPLDWFDKDVELFHDAPRFKGAPSPTLGSLELKNKDSRSILETYFNYRDSGDGEDQALAAGSLRKALRNERGTASPKTLAYLEALEGDFFLRQGLHPEALRHLEEAKRLAPADPYILDLLLQAYEDENRKLQEGRDWPRDVEDRIRTLSHKADALRRELRRLQTAQLLNRLSETWALEQERSCEEGCSARTMKLAFLTAERRSSALSYLTDATIARMEQRAAFQWTTDLRRALDLADRKTRRALLVGIDDYSPTSGFASLEYAVRDAERVAGAYARTSYDTEVLKDGKATRDNILRALALESLISRPGDDFVFYYSGHGFMDVRDESAIVTKADGAVGVGAVGLPEIERILSHHRGRAVVIIDSCRSGMDVNLGDLGGAARAGRSAGRLTIVMAGEPGGPALESRRTRSSLFTESLLRHLDLETHADRRAAAARGLTPPAAVPWNLVIEDTVELAERLYGVRQHPQVSPQTGPCPGSAAWTPSPASPRCRTLRSAADSPRRVAGAP